MRMSATVRMISHFWRRWRRACAAVGAVSTKASICGYSDPAEVEDRSAHRGGVAAAESAHQIYAEGKASRLQLRAQGLREQHLVLARQDAQVVIQARPITLAGKIVGTLRRIERGLLLHDLALE